MTVGSGTTIERRACGVTVLRLRRGPVNALDLDLCQALTTELTNAAQSGAIVLTGEGRAFSAGVDLTRLLAEGATYLNEFFPALDDLFRAAFTLPVPFVAAVNGHAVAGGAILAAAADSAVMTSDRATIGLPEFKLGVPLPQSALEVVRTRVGEKGAWEILLTGRNHAPAEAVSAGLVDEVADGDVVERAVEIARDLATATAPDTFAMTKRQLRREALRRIENAPSADVLCTWIRRLEDGSISRYVESTLPIRRGRRDL